MPLLLGCTVIRYCCIREGIGGILAVNALTRPLSRDLVYDDQDAATISNGCVAVNAMLHTCSVWNHKRAILLAPLHHQVLFHFWETAHEAFVQVHHMQTLPSQSYKAGAMQGYMF
jgi:hypothetical protein